MTRWGEVVESLRRGLLASARQATAHLSGRPGFPDAEDLAQEVLARLIAAYGAAELETWSFPRVRAAAHRTLHNLIVDLAKRKAVEVAMVPAGDGEDASLEVATPAPDPERAAAGREMFSIFRLCLATVLGREERQFLETSFELDSAPAARERLGWPEGTIDKTGLCHLRSRLVRRVLRCMEKRVGGPVHPRGTRLANLSKGQTDGSQRGA